MYLTPHPTAGAMVAAMREAREDGTTMAETQTYETAGVIAPAPLIYGGALALGLLLHRLIPLRIMSGCSRSTRRQLGGLLIVVGIFTAFWTALTMVRHGNNPEPSHPVVSLVVDGPFRFSRNPIYLSMTAGYLGAGLVAGTLWHIVLLPVVLAIMRRGVIEREEAYLGRRFGDEYRAYTAMVRRWL